MSLSTKLILWSDHSNKTSLPAILHGTICFSKFYEMKLEIFVEFCPWPHLAVKGLSMPTGDKVLRVSNVNNNISRALREKGCEK